MRERKPIIMIEGNYPNEDNLVKKKFLSLSEIDCKHEFKLFNCKEGYVKYRCIHCMMFKEPSLK